MKHIIKVFSLLTVFAVIPGAWAATSRVSMVNRASPRLPSIAGYVVATNANQNNVINTNNSAYYDNTECIDKYTDCAKDSDVCGADFEECTTRVLFHGQMAKCLSVLYQCQPGGITALFGTNNISALSAGEIRNTHDDITDYTYPTSGSVLGQLISGAAISNQLNTEQCIKTYTRCLSREEVCGADFELCTTPKEFKKQALLCDSTLARCQSAGKTQLFGSVANADTLDPANDSRLGQLIENGQQLAAVNAVRTCQKVTDNCLISACTKNPLRCVEGVSMAAIDAADFVTGNNELTGSTSTTQNIGGANYNDNYLTSLTGSEIRKMLKAQCLETIGTNKYCHMTYREKSPSNKDLMDIDLQEDVFSLAYAARKDAVNTKIQEAIKKFDTKAKDACYETIKSCAMRSCGGGLGSVCYELARDTNGNVHINSTGNNGTYNEIQSGCAAIVNADANCIYAATSADGYAYTYYDDENTTFKTLFPEYNNGSESDIIGAVGKLNALLATSYNDAAIENMKKQCETIAKSCVRSMCGKDYINCYRNRTDVISGSYATNTDLDRSMNKVGGILDYNIVMGLCMDTVKSSSVCEEHLKVATAEWRNSVDNASWGDNTSVRDAWLGANTTSVTGTTTNEIVIECYASGPAADGTLCAGTMEPINGACEGVMDENGCIYDQPLTETYSEYALSNGATTLFQKLLVEEEKRVQSIYNGKITKEQNVCLSNNNGGIVGANENGSTFMWVKLKSGRVPKTYAQKGLTENQFSPSSDLYGSFCRVKVTVTSDDKYIQDELGKDSTAYFAVGDVFTCGSWISQKTLQKISDKVANRALCEQGYGQWVDGNCVVDAQHLSAKEKRSWALGTVLPTVLAGIGGFAGTDALQRSGASLGGLLSGEGISTTSDRKEFADKCATYANDAMNKYIVATANGSSSDFVSAVNSANEAKKWARKAGVNVSNIDFVIPGEATTGSSGKYKWSDSTQINNIVNSATEIKSKAETSLGTARSNESVFCVTQTTSTSGTLTSAGTTNSQMVDAVQCQNAREEVSKQQGIINAASGVISAASRAPVSADDNSLSNAMVALRTKDSTFNVNPVAIDTIVPASDYASASSAYSSVTLKSNIETLSDACSDIADGKIKTSLGKNVLGGLISAGAAGGISWAITKNALEGTKENIKNEAAQQWMNEVGDHIQCYVGTEELGTYGDQVSIEID